MDRRGFVKYMIAAGVLCPSAWAKMAKHPLAGLPLPKWREGHLRISMIYTGRSEAAFLVFPDGTSMLLDCGDYGLKPTADVPFLPDPSRRAGEQTARYVLHENPNGRNVDYFLLTHYHSDHAGAPKYGAGRSRAGTHELSGIGEAIERLSFGRIIDRAWPEVDDPAPRPDDFDEATVGHVKEVYAEAVRRGTKIERFALEKGSRQIRMLHGGSAPFSCTPLCANGCILRRDGSVVDLGTSATPRSKFGENAMSIGFVVSLGNFRYFTAGDFSGRVRKDDGGQANIEDVLAAEVPQVDVAKANHHGCGSMPVSLAKALGARVYLAGYWHRRHMERDVMRRLSVSGRQCLYAPGFFPASRRTEEAGEDWMDEVAPESFVGAHAVVDVVPDGSAYRLMMVTAADESWRILGAYDFATSKKGS